MFFAAAMITVLLLISPVGGYVPPGGGGGDGGSGGSTSSASSSSGSSEVTYSGYTTAGTFTQVGENWLVSSCTQNCPTPVTMIAFRSETPTVESGKPPGPVDTPKDAQPIQVDIAAGSQQHDNDIIAAIPKIQSNFKESLIVIAEKSAESPGGSDNKKSAEAYQNQLNGNTASNGVRPVPTYAGHQKPGDFRLDTGKVVLKTIADTINEGNSATITAGRISDRVGTISGDLSLGEGPLETR
jgi:hypothetical protein